MLPPATLALTSGMTEEKHFQLVFTLQVVPRGTKRLLLLQ